MATTAKGVRPIPAHIPCEKCKEKRGRLYCEWCNRMHSKEDGMAEDYAITVREFREQLKLWHDKDEMIFSVDGKPLAFFRLKERGGDKPGEGICSCELNDPSELLGR